MKKEKIINNLKKEKEHLKFRIKEWKERREKNKTYQGYTKVQVMKNEKHITLKIQEYKARKFEVEKLIKMFSKKSTRVNG